MTTILCTHCADPVRLATTEDVETLGPVFCSERCRELDAVRRLAPPRTPVRVLVAVVHNGPVLDTRVAVNFMAIGWGDRIPKAKSEFGIAAIDFALFSKAPRVDTLRNRAIAQALRDGFTHVLFLDADMVHPDDLLHQILQYCARQIVVSGLYVQRQYPYAPIAFRDSVLHESGAYRVYRSDDAYTEVGADGLREEELVGMGCALIPLSIVATLGPSPWFEYRNDSTGEPLISEDVPFCEKVRAAGHAIYLDPSIRCGHLYSDFATDDHYRRAREVLVHTQERLREQMAVTLERLPAEVQ